MNTKKIFFAFLGLAFAALFAVSTDVITPDDVNGDTAIERSRIRLEKPNA